MLTKSILHTEQEVRDWFSVKADILAFDWETTGLKYLEMEPVGISFCDGKRVCYVNLEIPNNQHILQFLSTVFDSNAKFIAHNAKFDLNCCHKFCGSTPANIFDTFTAAFLLDENRDSYKLKVLAVQDLGISAKDVQKWKEAEACGHHSEKWYEYCLNDSIWAYDLYKIYTKGLKEQNLEYLANEIEMPFVHVLAYMERTGVLVDKQKLKDIQEKLEEYIQKTEDELLELAGLKLKVETNLFGETKRVLPINFKSPQQMKELFQKLNLPIPKDKKKKESLDKKLLAPFAGVHKFIEVYLEYKSLIKLQGSYVTPAWDLIDADGRIRPSYGKARTGRLTCSHPNLQNLPRLSEKYPDLNFRSIFIAGEGKSLLAPDYSGQELRLLGVVANDEVIIDAFRRNLDLHLLTADRCFSLNLTTEQLTNGTKEFKQAKEQYGAERYKAKNGANFPIIYGTTAHGVSWRQGVSIQEAQRWIDSFFELYPDVKRAMDDTERELKERGFVTTLYGRRRRFPGFKYLNPFEKSRCIRQAFNFKIQGSAADQVKIAMNKVYGMGISIVLMVHDEIVNEVPDNEVKEVGERVANTMKNAVSFCIPFEVDYKIAKSYGELK